MAKSNKPKKQSAAQRRARTYQIIFVIVSIIIILTFVLSLLH
jgi:predicted nucleic acid-binding Zn ribbon protein